jgi:hypothetical protein
MMKSYNQFKQFIDSRPAFNNPRDDDSISGMDDKLIEKEKEMTLYGGGIKSLKQRMKDAHKRYKRQQKIDKLQSTNQWQGLE